MKYSCIAIDPPWSYSNKATRAKAEDHYGTMSAEAIQALDIGSLAEAKAHLYCWVTAGHLELALQCIRAWGFDYKLPIVWVKTTAIETRVGFDVVESSWVVWHSTQHKAKDDVWPSLKLQIGLGNYFRHADELCLFATRGGAPGWAKNLPTVFFAPRQEHSAKPEMLQKFAEIMSLGPRLELFARRARPGWVCIGNELNQDVESFISAYRRVGT